MGFKLQIDADRSLSRQIDRDCNRKLLPIFDRFKLLSLLETSRRLTRKIEATVKKEEEKEGRGGPGEPVLRLLLLLPSWSSPSSAIIFPFSFSLSLSLFRFVRHFSAGNQARIRYRRISPINLLLFSSLLFLCFFYSLSRIRSDSSHCLGFFPFLLVRIVFTKLSGSIVITHKERGVPWEGNNNRKGNLIESRSSIGCGTRDKMIVSNDSFPRYANPHILRFHSN